MTNTRTAPQNATKTSIRARVTSRLEDARDAVGDVAGRAADAIEASPISVLVGGIAVGLVAGALIPRSEREKAALAPIGKRIAEGATAAIAAAKATGKEQLTASIMSRDAAKEGARKVFDSAFSAAKAVSQTIEATPKSKTTRAEKSA